MYLEDLIAGGETESLEFKECPNSDPKKYLRTAVAFANCGGGTLLFGVGDDGGVVGIQGNVGVVRDQIVDSIFSNVFPIVYPNVYAYTIDGKNLIVMEIPAQNQLPVYLRSEGPEKGVYMRYGASTRAAEAQDIGILSLESSMRSPDSIIVPGTIATDNEQATWLCSKLSKRKGDEVTLKDLIGLGLMEESDGNIQRTMAFRLLTDNPYSHAVIQCARFIGKGEMEFSDRTDYGGSILIQAERGVEYILSMIGKPSKIDGLYRDDGFEIPVAAIREIILNAIMHRNYNTDMGPISIAVFDDRVEVTSPGGLPKGQTYEKMLLGYSMPRNRLLATVFKECWLAEGWGRGIRRVNELCDAKGLRRPSVEVLGNAVRVTLFRRSSRNVTLTSTYENESTVMEFFLDNPTSTISDLCGKSALSKHDAEVAIRSLKEKGVLKRVGSRKRGEWLIEKKVLTETDS